MKKIFIVLAIACVTLGCLAYEYVPKNTSVSPFASQNNVTKSTATKVIPAGMREIKNIDEYFRYLPKEVQRHWTPYKANVNYTVTVQFTISRDGSVSDIRVTNSTYPSANMSVINAVKSGAPYQPLPSSYKKDSVRTEMVLEYRKA